MKKTKEQNGKKLFGESEQKNLNTSEEIISSFKNKIDLILDVGALTMSKGSSVLDTTTSPPTLLREGDVSLAEIEELLGYEIYTPTFT